MQNNLYVVGGRRGVGKERIVRRSVVPVRAEARQDGGDDERCARRLQQCVSLLGSRISSWKVGVVWGIIANYKRSRELGIWGF